MYQIGEVYARSCSTIAVPGSGSDAEALGVVALAQRGVARPEGLPHTFQAAAFLFEGIALVALYLLLEGRTGLWWLDGVATGFAAWLFRGPLLVLTIAALTRLPTEPFWQVARLALIAEPAAGLAIAALFRAGRRA